MCRSACRRVLGEFRGRGGSAKAVVGSEGALQGYRRLRVHDSAAFVPDRDNRQKGRPPRGVDDMGGVALRKRGMWVVLGGWGLESFGLGETERAREAESSSGGVNRGGGESRLVVQRDNTPSPRTL